MAKRSDFERIERDYYRTFDPKAGEALRPFIDGVKSAFEPFAGAADLTNQFPEIKWAQTDIEPQNSIVNKRDAFEYTQEEIDFEKFDALITNPPWSRPILHKTIEYFAPKIQTWLLLDANWMFTKQAAPYMHKYCTDIVVIGRVKWIPDTNMSGKDDCCWYRFSADKEEPTRFFGRI